MDPAQTSARPHPAPAFEDGFGRRQQVVGAAKDPVEVLVLRREHMAVAGFEAAVRERIEAASRFQHDSFVRIRGLARLAKAESGMALVSERVDGVRVSQLLDPAMKRSLDINGALLLIGQLVDAVAALHEAVPGGHGAIAPERLILRPDARLAIADHVFGTALPKLSLSAEHLWDQLQIAVPDAPSPVFDQQTDLYQVGSVALALALGRPLGAEYPHRVTGLDASKPLTLSAALESLPREVSAWISRTLLRRGHQPFASAMAAREAFTRLLVPIDRTAGRAAVLAFLSGEPIEQPKTARPAATPAPTAASAPAPALSKRQQKAQAKSAAQSKHATESASNNESKSATDSKPMFERVEAVTQPAEESATPFGAVSATAAPNLMRRFLVPMTRRTIGVAAAVLMMLTTGGAFAAKRYFAPATPAVAKGTLAVTTTPAGANVVIDGAQRGTAPLTVELEAGDHVLLVNLNGSSRSVPFKVAPGAQVSQVIDLPKVVAPTGQLQIRTEPSGARVTIDGQKRGASPLTIEGLMPGPHTVTVEGARGSVTQQVTIEGGVTAALVVPLNTTAPETAPATGWIAVNAPFDVQISEKGQSIGTNRDRITASPGRHDLDIVNDALGFRVTRTISVTAGEVSSMKIDPPKGSLSLNATPWAEVYIDGNRIGETPIGNVQLTIGTHEVVFRHPELGEQKFTPTITSNAPARLSADFRRTQ
jgi:hypothetical protein